MAVLPLYAESPSDAPLDVAISHALLLGAAAGRRALRLWTPPDALSFGRLDLLSEHRERALDAARAQGFTPVRRLAGGRVAPMGANTVCLGVACPSGEVADMQPRYEEIAGVLVEALTALGVPARLGELPGEWCPGRWSVIVGEAKVAGLAQRVIRDGAWAEAVLIVSGSGELRRALDVVQSALGVAWAAGTFGALADSRPDLTHAQVIDAVEAALAPRWSFSAAALPETVWEQARALRGEHAL